MLALARNQLTMDICLVSVANVCLACLYKFAVANCQTLRCRDELSFGSEYL